MLTSITPNNVSILQDFVRTGRVEQVINTTQIRVTLSLEKRAIEVWAEFAMGGWMDGSTDGWIDRQMDG